MHEVGSAMAPVEQSVMKIFVISSKIFQNGESLNAGGVKSKTVFSNQTPGENNDCKSQHLSK